ncbi:MAG: hypothetical protein KDA85_05990, partial [Planctomycetaceae bacterium]|nr:hypothetical protein [Planctomycetaceae bacterium]
ACGYGSNGILSDFLPDNQQSECGDDFRRCVPMLNLRVAVVLLSIIPVGGTHEPAVAQENPGQHFSDGDFLQNGVTAHRGNSGQFPENTMAAFRSGIEVGADWIELDIVRTKDGKLAVIHDLTTKRTGDVDLSVTESTWEELRRVDVATDFRHRNQLTLAACPLQTIPLLEDVLKLVMTQHRTRVSIQPKTDCVADAVALIEQLHARPWVGFNDGNLSLMAKVKQLSPRTPVYWDRPAGTDVADDIRTAQQYGFAAIVIHHSGVTRDKVQQIRAAGLEAGAWTINETHQMQALLKLGVQRIYTDDPARLLEQKKPSF